MAQIDEKYLVQLRSAGLFVSHPFGAFLGGVWVVKPISTAGHNIAGYKNGGYISLDDAPLCPDSDAPMLKFICIDQNRWQVDGQDCAGGMGPADFIDEWLTAEEAIKDILDFYFGDPTRMKRKADEKEKQKNRREARKQASTEPI
jgi:hypothetical protein